MAPQMSTAEISCALCDVVLGDDYFADVPLAGGVSNLCKPCHAKLFRTLDAIDANRQPEPVEHAKDAFDAYAAMGEGELPSDTWSAMQVRLFRWQTRNFGGASKMQILAGVTEEVGELAHALLKREQGIRGYDDRDKFIADAGDAIADATIYLIQLCTALRLDFDLLVYATAERVMDRDWVSDRKGGG